MEQGPWDFS
ncbi:uncharacterized protein FFNC_15709 [Fusarium fujikuroi]|nr:uncharacterized protein FFNC_15709 [Fusarium fujikuroi]